MAGTISDVEFRDAAGAWVGGNLRFGAFFRPRNVRGGLRPGQMHQRITYGMWLANALYYRERRKPYVKRLPRLLYVIVSDDRLALVTFSTWRGPRVHRVIGSGDRSAVRATVVADRGNALDLNLADGRTIGLEAVDDPGDAATLRALLSPGPSAPR